MPINNDVAIAMVHSLGLMALIALVYGLLSRAHLHPVLRRICFGYAVGIAAVFAMLAPAVLPSGGILDGRSIIVGLGAMLGGIPAALVAAGIAAAYRFFIVGGFGAPIGATGIIFAALIGVALRWHFKGGDNLNLKKLTIAGIAISAHFPSIYLFLPIGRANAAMQSFFPVIFAASVVGTIVLGTMINRERQMIDNEKRLKEMAGTDGLTGLVNRRAFERTLSVIERQVAFSNDTPSSILLLDIDHFKSVNDRFGHAEGDLVLKKIATILSDATRSGDIAARIGGEEFCIYLKGADEENARIVAENLLKKIRSTSIVAKNQLVPITASIGVAQLHSEGGDDLNSLDSAMRAADIALYQAKDNGRDQLCMSSRKKAA